MSGTRTIDPAQDAPEALLARGLNLPPQPAALLALQVLAERGDPDVRAVADAISRDAALTAGLYRMARSPLFARPSPPQTVDQVVLLLGIPRTLALAQALCIQTALPGESQVLARFWARSRAIAQLATLIAQSPPVQGRVSGDLAFLAGMFHDCGVPILMQRFPGYCRSTGIEGVVSKWADVATEDRLYSADHAVIGFLLARHWRLPDAVAQAVRFHHEGESVPSRQVGLLMVVLRLAMHLYAEEMRLCEGVGDHDEADILERLELGLTEYREMIEYVLERYHELEH